MDTTMTEPRIDRGSTPATAIYSIGGSLYFERTFDAPRERVWQAFTDPEIVPRWWGKHGTTTVVEEMDVRVGGAWRYVSHADDRDPVAFFGEYLEIDRPGRLVYTEIFEPFPDAASVVTQRLDEEQGKTRLTVTARYDSRQTRDIVLGTGMEKGAAVSYDRLEDVVAALRP